MCVPSLTNRVAHPVVPPLKPGRSLFDLLRNDVASIALNGNGNVQQQQQQSTTSPLPAGVTSTNDVAASATMMVVDSTPGDFHQDDATALLRSGSAASSTAGSSASPSASSVDAVVKKGDSESASRAEKARPKRRRRRNQLKPGKTAKQQDRHFVVHNYHDHADDPEQPGLAAFELQRANNHVNGHGPVNRGGVATPFPSKLHAALSAIESEGKSDVASWQPHGRCFIVHKPKEFQADLLPKYFNLSKITSFQRQLNLYGFTRLSRGGDRGGYYHELFLRGRPTLCHRIARKKTKGTRFKAASSPESEPDFYSMAPVGPARHAGDVNGGETMEVSPSSPVEKSVAIRPPAVPVPPPASLSKVGPEPPLPEPFPFSEARRPSFPPPPAEVFSSFSFKAVPAPSSPALSPISPRRRVQQIQGPPSNNNDSIPPLEVSLSMMMFDGPQDECQQQKAGRHVDQPFISQHSPIHHPPASMGNEDFSTKLRRETDPFEPLPVEPNKMIVEGCNWANLFAGSDARALEMASAAAANRVSESSSSSSSSSSLSSSSSELDDARDAELCGDLLSDGGVDPIDDFVKSMISIDDDVALGDYLDVLVDC